MSLSVGLPWDEAVAAIEAVDGTVVLACHAGPDGDALGAMLALHLHLRRRGIDSVASFGDDPFVVPQQYGGLPGLDQLTRPAEVPAEPALLVTMDLAEPTRLGALEPLAATADTVLVIDHHRGGNGFGDVRLVDPAASSTVVLVEGLLLRLGATIDEELATCLYVGLVTDTGRFQYEGTDADTLAFAGRLLDTGIDHADIARRIFDTHSMGYLKLLGRVLERATVEPGLRLVHAWFDDADLAWAGCSLQETESVIDLLRTVDAADVTMVGKRVAGAWRISLRSDGAVDVSAVARRLGGGGHLRAAGATLDGRTFEEALSQVRTALPTVARSGAVAPDSEVA